VIVKSIGHEVLEVADGTDVVITSEVSYALRQLKDTDARIVIALPLGHAEASVEAAAKSLAEAYPGRVDIVPLIAFGEREEIVPYILRSFGSQGMA
jgi:hypothetical protein